MRFWCSVSDRCSGKIGEGKVPPPQLQLCLCSLFGTKGPCHMCHDWWGCRRILKAYLHETPEGEPMQACRFVLPLFVLHTPHPNTYQRGILQHNQNQFYISRNDSSHHLGPLDITPNVSLTILRHLRVDLPQGRSRWSKHHCSTSLPHLFVILVSFWAAHDKWFFRGEIISSYLTTKSILRKAKLALVVDHSGDLICSSVLFWGLRMSPVSLGWFEEQWSGCAVLSTE